MGNKRDLLLKDMIGILVRLPIVSLLRFKAVCKSWLALIETSSFTDLYFNSDKKFGSFILHAAIDFERFREDAVFMLSSVSESESTRSESESESESSSAGYVKSFGLWSTGFNGICGECDSESGGSGWRWSTNDGRCCTCGEFNGICRECDCGSGSGWRRSTNDGRSCCSCGKWNNISRRELSSNDDDEQQPQQQQQLVLKLGNLGFPSCYNFGKPPIVVGSCNGIVCLYDKQPNEVSLWNPATRQFRILPKPSSSITTIAGNGNGNVHRLFAFGFDEETNDYKVVLLIVSNRRMLDFVIKGEPATPMECICQVEVYCSSTDSWRLLEGITCLPGYPYPYPPDSSSELIYLNGSCFFLAKLLYSSSEEEEEEEEEQCIPPPKLGDRFMISLDLTNESITPIELSVDHYCSHLYLCYLGKKIALISNTSDYTEVGGSEDFFISVFNEHSSSLVDCKPWVSFFPGEFKIQLGLPGERNIPRGISNDAVFVLLETEIPGGLGNKKKKKKKKKKMMKLYNLVTKEVKDNFLSCDQVLSKAFPYKPSLVSFPPTQQPLHSSSSSSRYGDWKGR